MRIMRPLAFATLATVFAAPAIAQDEVKDRIYINPFAGFQLFDDERDLSETATFGVGAEYRFLPRWAVELVGSHGDADRKYRSGRNDFDSVRLDGIYYLANPTETWNPYVSAGVGHMDFDGDPGINTLGTNHDETRVNVGVGMRYNINERLSLRGDLREFHGVDESTWDTLATLGLSVAFGRKVEKQAPEDSDTDGVPDSRDQCPNTPVGRSVDSRGCELDSDNDGVVDGRDQCPGTKPGVKVNASGCEVDSDNDGVLDSVDQCPNTPAGAKVDEFGCEGITETVETIELSVKFPTNSSVIGDRFDNEIREVADFMREHPETTVEIAGHTDSRGEASYNQFLSQRRAEAVATRLTDVLGVDEDRVTAVGYGETEPAFTNETAAGRAQNRRVEARIQVRR
ncbi:OmpA family protein [Marinobacter sp.]|uniref:OmpA family protein n=1 Tax=Marinobacter sp. TaxID=50741 RepID=UPI00384CD3E9